MITVWLPEFNWFVNTAGGYPSTNDYTGSVETDPHFGGVSQNNLGYRVWVTDLGKDTARLCAVILLKKAWEDGSCANQREQLDKQDFECSPQGLKQAVQWLNETLPLHLAKERK